MKRIILFLALLLPLAATAQVTPYKFGPMWLDSAEAHGLGDDSSATFKALAMRGSITFGEESGRISDGDAGVSREVWNGSSYTQRAYAGPSGMNITGSLSVSDQAGSGNRVVMVDSTGKQFDSSITITPTFVSVLTALGYTTISGSVAQNEGFITAQGYLAIANQASTGQTPPTTPGTYLDNPTTYQYFNVFSSYKSYQKFIFDNLMVGPGN